MAVARKNLTRSALSRVLARTAAAKLSRRSVTRRWWLWRVCRSEQLAWLAISLVADAGRPPCSEAGSTDPHSSNEKNTSASPARGGTCEQRNHSAITAQCYFASTLQSDSISRALAATSNQRLPRSTRAQPIRDGRRAGTHSTLPDIRLDRRLRHGAAHALQRCGAHRRAGLLLQCVCVSPPPVRARRVRTYPSTASLLT